LDGTAVIIKGNNLPTSDFTVAIGNVECTTDSMNALETEITCSLPEAPAAGCYNVVITTEDGAIAVLDGTPEIEVEFTIT
jgi:hypothetical protein